MSQTGVVQWFNTTKGYGVIKPDEGEQDVFVHHRGVEGNPLQEGGKVEFETSLQDNGKDRAEKVTGGTGRERRDFGRRNRDRGRDSGRDRGYGRDRDRGREGRSRRGDYD